MTKIRNAYYFHFQRPQPVSPSRSVKSPSADAISLTDPLLHSVLDETISSEILERCRVNSIAINDLALAILFQVCRQWNEQSGIASRSTRMRLLMPFDLRGRADMNLPATNRLSFAFLGRTHAQCENWDALLASVQSETQSIKESRVYMDFLQGLEAVASKPDLMRRFVKWSSNMSTKVLTYTGDISRGMKNHFPEENGRRRIGDTCLENVLIAPPRETQHKYHIWALHQLGKDLHLRKLEPHYPQCFGLPCVSRLVHNRMAQVARIAWRSIADSSERLEALRFHLLSRQTKKGQNSDDSHCSTLGFLSQHHVSAGN